MKEQKLESKSKRVRRNTLRTVGPLYVDPKYNRPGFRTRWVNDIDGNLEKFMTLGYNPVERDIVVGDQRAATSHRLGNVVTKSVGGGITAVFCEIPEDLHAELQIDKEEINLENDKALGRTGIPTQYGEIDLGQ